MSFHLLEDDKMYKTMSKMQMYVYEKRSIDEAWASKPYVYHIFNILYNYIICIYTLYNMYIYIV